MKMKLLFLALAATAAAGAWYYMNHLKDQPDEKHWDYGHEEDWPYEGDPKVQSPIEVPKRAADRQGGADQLPGEYAEMKVQSVENNGHAFQLNFGTDGGGNLEAEAGKAFKLVQLHFHSPSEHTQPGYAGWTDEKDKTHPGHYAMEVHFVHKAAEDDPEAPKWRNDLAVVGVFIKEGAPNEALQKIWDDCPGTKGENTSPDLTMFNASDLMPRVGDFQTYIGSLTTPPLSSGVSWFVMDEPIEASPEQIKKLREAMKRNTNRSIQGRLDSSLRSKK